MDFRTEPICYVSMPFGTKPLESGEPRDFDLVYHDLVCPAVQSFGLRCVRADEFSVGANIQTELYRAIIGAELMIADVTTNNPNVLYELGVRHGTSLGPTLIVHASGHRPPFNLQSLFMFQYPADIGDYAAVQGRFQAMVDDALAQRGSNPVVTAVPELESQLVGVRVRPPRWRAEPGTKAYVTRTKLEQLKTMTAPDDLVKELRTVESEVDEVLDTPRAVADLLQAYRKALDWGGLINFVGKLPPDVQGSKAVALDLALAYSRRGSAGDVDRGIEVAERIREQEADAETLGVLGRLYKDRGDAEAAIDAYREAYDLDPSSVHTGTTLATLLYTSRGHADAELAHLIPRVRATIEEQNRDLPPSAWSTSSAMRDLQLAMMGGDWGSAHNRASVIAAGFPAGGLSSLRSRRAFATTLKPFGDVLEGTERGEYDEVIGILLGGDPSYA